MWSQLIRTCQRANLGFFSNAIRQFSMLSPAIRYDRFCIQPNITCQQSLLQPMNILATAQRGLKQVGRPKRRCKDCYFVMRQERLYVMCKTHPRHKQMAMKKRKHNTWILTDATQSTRRAW